MQKKLFIQTLGCAMNVRDSDHIIAELKNKENYEITEDIAEADLILINTCSVREKPEKRLFSEIGQFAKIKKQGAKIGICGCTASSLGDTILKRSRAVDFVLGARNVSKISQIIHQKRVAWVDIDYDDSNYVFESDKKSKVRASLNISIGCDKKCSYCIVPHTRGQEISIPADLLLNEAKKLVDSGAREILLLGQNVNNYGKTFSSPHRPINFTQFLKEISEIPNLKRIRFTSPHPLHMDNAFIEEFSTNPKICKNIHMPLQSGSTKILKAMRRGYSKEWFLDRVARLRDKIPHLTIGTDIIVGYPGESEEDFADTLDVLEKVRFDTLYSFIYSPRPKTPAEHLEELPREITAERLSILQKRHKEILAQENAKELGNCHEVLFESAKIVSSNNLQEALSESATARVSSPSGEWFFCEGRSDSNKLVRVFSKNNLVHSFANVTITQVNGAQLIGEIAP